MSDQITTAFVQQFESNVFHLSQQKGSRLSAYVRQESQQGEAKAYERLGATNAYDLTSRHADTQYVNSEHSRRWVYLRDSAWADLIDEMDKVRLLIDPTSPYAQAAGFALGRKRDLAIINAGLGAALGGHDYEAASSTILPASQYVGAVTGSALGNMKVSTLIAIKSKFGVNDVDTDGMLNLAVSQSQIDSLLGDNTLTSADYNTVKALVNGEVDTFMGFKFHRTQLMPKSSDNSFSATINVTTGVVTLTSGNGNGARRCMAWAKDGIVLAVGKELKTSIDVLPQKNYSTQVYARHSIGAVRLEEAKVVCALCTE